MVLSKNGDRFSLYIRHYIINVILTFYYLIAFKKNIQNSSVLIVTIIKNGLFM